MGQHFLLIHGLGHGAWTWYKTVALLEEEGHRATALDNPAQGKDATDPESIATLAQLSSNFVNFLQSLPESEKVILVAHCYGGLVATYILEHFPHKISAAVFVSGYMFASQDLETIAKFMDPSNAPPGSCDFTFGRGPDQFPTTLHFANPRGWIYQLTPPENVILAKTLLKPGAFLAPEEAAIKHTPERYGSVPRVYIRNAQDLAVTPQAADFLISATPPSEVLHIDTDHSPFFSAPTQLHQHLIHVAEAYA